MNGRWKNEQTDNTIDFLKFIFAIFVVGIHAGILSNCDFFATWFLMHWLFRIAVPFFFVISGYYLGKKLKRASDDEVKMVFKDYRNRLVPPLLLWGGIGIIIQSINMYQKDISLCMIFLYDIRTAIFYPQGAMWFVWACIIASYIIQVFWKYKNLKLLGIIASFGYCFALLCNTYYFAIEDTKVSRVVDDYMYYCISARNGVFVGTLFILEGVLLSIDKIQSIVKRVSGWKCWTAFVILEFFFFCEICFSYRKNIIDDSSLFIVFPFLIPMIVILAVRYNMKIDLPYKTLRNLSTTIYFTHRFILIMAFHFISSRYIVFGIVLASTIIIGEIAQKINKPFLRRFVI